jgi:adenylate cyclase class 2
MSPCEVELKFRVPELDAVRGRLLHIGSKPAGRQHECDVYYGHPVRQFADTDEALRTRQSAGRLWITYKGPKIDRSTKTRTEIELELLPTADAPARLAELLQALGFRPVRTVPKDREAFDLAWQGQAVHATLDTVAGVGHFVELETQSDAAGLDAARAALAALATTLELVQAERRSYLELLLEADRAAALQPEQWSEV